MNLPHNLPAEAGLLGNILYDNKMLDRIDLKPEHFYAPAHQRIFSAIGSLIDKGMKAGFVSLSQQFENDEDLKDVGGKQYIADLAASVISLYNTEDYAKIIRDQFNRREMIEAAERMRVLANDANTENVFSEAEKVMAGLSENRSIREYQAAEAASEALHWVEAIQSGQIKPVRTGYKHLDQKVSGFFAGRLYIIAARPGMGKTAFGLSLADNIAQTSPCLFLSLEMTAQELAMRLIAARSGISVDRQQNPEGMTGEDWQKMKGARNDMSGLKLTIHDGAGMDIHGIKAAARRHKRKHGAFTLFIDYLGLVMMDRKITNKVHQIEDITTALKTLAKELEIPVVLLSQLSRAVENRDDKTPNLAGGAG